MTDWPLHRIAWRDAVLDRLVVVLAKNQDTADLGRRLHACVQGAREIEAQEHDGWDAKRSRPRLATWTAERLVELGRKRRDPDLRPVKIAWLGLEGHFRSWAEKAGTRSRAWRACVRLAERRLAEDVGAGRLRGPLRQLTPALRDDVIFTQAGKIRTPKAMAFQLLWLAVPLRPRGQTADDRETIRIQLEHLKLVPPAL